MRPKILTMRLIFAWYDFWIGLYWDRAMRRLYLFPVPCCGLMLDFAPNAAWNQKPVRASGMGAQ